MGTPEGSVAVNQPNQEAWLPGHLEPHGRGLPVLPIQAVGRHSLWDAPPIVTLGEDLQQGRAGTTGLDRNRLLPFLAAANPQTFSTSLYPHFQQLQTQTLLGKETRAELHLIFKMSQLFSGEYPCHLSEKSFVQLIPSLFCCRRQELRRQEQTTHCFIDSMSLARLTGKDGFRIISMSISNNRRLCF